MEPPAHGNQEGSSYNGHFTCDCYHPMFVFNQDGEVVRALLRPGHRFGAAASRPLRLVHVAKGYQAYSPV